MILLLHILIAISSIGFAVFGYSKPTNTNLRASYTLAGLTLASGIYLVVSGSAQMLHACMSGVMYLAVVYAAIYATKRKMAKLQSQHVTT